MTVRIGCGAGCSFDRIEPAKDLIEFGNLDYIIFECLAERTMADNVLKKEDDPSAGYTPMLKERMEKILALALKKETKIITNMGGANIESAIEVVKNVAHDQNLSEFKIGAVYGDDVKQYLINEKLVEDNKIDRLISANAYTGIEGIVQLLENDCDVIITGRIADTSLFVAPIIHEYGWKNTDDKFAQATLLGHLLECAGQVTGGYAADPGYKDIPNLWNLGFPIAEIESSGEFIISKLDNTGGEISERICKEQLVYEIESLEKYYTPNAIVDFSRVTFKQLEENEVKVSGATIVGQPDTLKISACFHGKYLGIGEISFAGCNAYNKAMLCQNIIENRLKLIGIDCEYMQFDLIGVNSLNKNKNILSDNELRETRLRMSVKDSSREKCTLAIREIDFMYTNGPAGSSGLDTRIKPLIEIENMLIPISDVELTVDIIEVSKC